MSTIKHMGENSYAILGSDSLMLLDKALSAEPRKTIDPDQTGSETIKFWGDDNDYPAWVLEQIKDVTLVEPILDWKARALYSGGLAYGILSVDEKGEETFKRIIDTEIEEWLENTDISNYIESSSIAYYTFNNIFAQLTQSRTGKKTTFLTALDTVECRFKRKDNKGTIKQVYVSPDWQKYFAEDKETLKFDLFNPIYSDHEDFKKPNNQFVYSLNTPSPGKGYYAKAPWHVILETWLPIARAIPAFKKALLKNQLTLKYIIKVPEWWWEWKYKDWHTKSEKEQIAAAKKEQEDFEAFFKGDRQGKSFIYTQRDSTHAKTYSEWEVIVVDDKLKTGMYIEDSQEADAHIFKNLAVDPTLFGNGSGKDRSGAGSGSDKRVAWNNYILMTKPHQDKILRPLQLVSNWNGWQKRLAPKENEKLVFWMKNYQIARLDSGKETAENDKSVES
tara:strand:+ start:93 stop:1433 length:1341 start_codon:yes stop_codon:yes gene_type:complete